MKIAGICGSLRAGSFNRMLLEAAQKLCPAGAAIDIVDFKDLPLFNQDLEGNLPEAVKIFKAKIAACDAVLFVTPEYNYSLPGPLKNAIDWGSRPYGASCWSGKPVCVMGATSGNSGTAKAQQHLRQCFVFLNMQPVQQPEVLMMTAATRFNDKGELTDDYFKKNIPEALAALVALTKTLKGGEQ